MTHQFFIKGRMKGLNEYITAERTNRFMAAKMKKNQEAAVVAAFRKKFPDLKIKNPILLHYEWHEPNKLRDHDNVAFAQKFIQDALVKCGAINDDNWNGVVGFTHCFKVDKVHPGVNVVIEELDGYTGSAEIGEVTGDRIRELRAARGWSLTDLEHASGVNKKNISKVENKKMRLGFEAAQKIADAFGVPVGYVTGVEDGGEKE